LRAAGSGLLTLLFAAPAQATLVRGLSLESLARESDAIVLGTSLSASSHWAELGGRSRIVTDTLFRVDEVVAQAIASHDEFLVQTLGGTIGDLAALVDGEATLGLAERCLLFLVADGEVMRVAGMAQGHYPLLADPKRTLRLLKSPRLPKLLVNSELAVRRLSGQQVVQAVTLIREALAR
jgi:hypothetical protein